MKDWKEKSKVVKASQALQKMIAMISVSFKKNDTFHPWEVRSYSEKKVKKSLIGLKNRIDVLSFHQTTFSRIYPKGTRFDSSNYNPMDAWAHGAQIVALNFQTTDEF
jgi:hypothetical protein